VEQLSQVLRETSYGVANRRLERILRETFSPRREVICKACSLRPEYCLGSVADWHSCRYALRVNGDKIAFPSDLSTEKEEAKAGILTKEIEDLIVKTLRRVRVLTAPRERITS
jgi:hypothetical protein